MYVLHMAHTTYYVVRVCTTVCTDKKVECLPVLVCDIGFECVVCDDHVVFLALPVEVRGHDNVGVHDGEEVPTGPTPDVNRRGAAVLQHDCNL